MKNLIIIGLILLSYSLTAQENTKPNFRHEIGVNLFSYNNVYEQYGGSEYVTKFDFGEKYAFVNGLSYRYHFEKSALRFNFQYQYANYDRISNGYYWETGDIISGTIWSMETRLGYERYLGTKKVKPYVAIDFLYKYGFSDVNYFLCDDPLCDPIPPPNLRTNMFGLVPALGLWYQFTNRFSARLETNAIFGVQQIEETSKFLIPLKTTNDPLATFIVNPISTLSVNFRF